MTDDDLDASLLIGLHKLCQQNGEVLGIALHECLTDREAVRSASAEIIRLPGLHERGHCPIYPRVSREGATIIAFPAPRWQRNASRQRG